MRTKLQLAKSPTRRAAQKKVSAVTAPELQDVKAACLKQLDTAAKHISSNPK